MTGADLEAIRLFAELPAEQREQLAGVCSEIEVEAGSTLVQEGDFGYVMFAILEGDADVNRQGELVNRLGPGDVFGERAILLGGRRHATVVAKTPMRLITVMNRDVWRLEREHPNVAESLRNIIAGVLPA